MLSHGDKGRGKRGRTFNRSSLAFDVAATHGHHKRNQDIIQSAPFDCSSCACPRCLRRKTQMSRPDNGGTRRCRCRRRSRPKTGSIANDALALSVGLLGHEENEIYLPGSDPLPAGTDAKQINVPTYADVSRPVSSGIPGPPVEMIRQFV